MLEEHAQQLRQIHELQQKGLEDNKQLKSKVEELERLHVTHMDEICGTQ